MSVGLECFEIGSVLGNLRIHWGSLKIPTLFGRGTLRDSVLNFFNRNYLRCSIAQSMLSCEIVFQN
jgi:hypothetical protein